MDEGRGLNNFSIELNDIGKKFNTSWIFRKLHFFFETGSSYTIIGPNGSGKSTLLQIIAGILGASEGKVAYSRNHQTIAEEEIFKYIAWVAPYLELIEEFTLHEFIQFHIKFKPLKDASIPEIIKILHFEKFKDTYIKHFSSGMKQRLKLGLAFYTNSPILLLDEPTSNLDAKWIKWYQEEVARNLQDRLLIICSNQPYEYEFCKNIFTLG